MSDKKKELEEYYSPYTQLSQDALNKWQNREDFKYDLDSDAIYNQYKNNYMNQGKLASKDVMGQASALTGGYANSYMQTVGNQAYQGYLQKLNDIVPELQQNAYNKYLQEGEDLYKQWQLMSSLENQDYSRYLDKQSQANWQTQFDYQKEQDALAQENWQKQFDADEAYRKWQMSKASSGSGGKTTTNVAYDNGNVSQANIKKMQEYLGVEQTGYWDKDMYNLSGGKTADEAWEAYDNTLINEDGTVERGLVADKNYAAEGNGYTYDKNMTETPLKELTSNQAKALENLYEKATTINDKVTDEDRAAYMEQLWNRYVNLKNLGYDVSGWSYIFDKDFIKKHS